MSVGCWDLNSEKQVLLTAEPPQMSPSYHFYDFLVTSIRCTYIYL